MKFLFITEYYPATVDGDVHGGVELRVYKVASFLANRHEVTVIAVQENDKPRMQILNGVKVRRIGKGRNYIASPSISKFFGRLGFIFSAIRLGLTEESNIVEGSSYIGWFSAWWVAKMKRAKAVVLVADVIDNSFDSYLPRLFKIILMPLQRFILSRNWDAVISISNTVAHKLDLNVGVKEKVRVIYCGAEVRKIRRVVVKKNTSEVVCVARLVKYKRIADLVVALKKVMVKVPFVTLTIVGIGEEYSRIKYLTKILGLSKNVRLLGFIPRQKDVWRVIKQGKIFCLPSELEGFGIVTVEALAAGVPVVLADIPIHNEVTQGKGALFFAPKDISSLASQLTRLLTDKLLYQRLKKETFPLAMRYDWQKICQETEDLYVDLYTH